MYASVSLDVPSIVSNVTHTMCGMSFQASNAGEDDLEPWCAVELALKDGHRLCVALASDEIGCRTLAARMFQCETSSLDGGMVEDTMRELSNIVAGQIKRALGIDEALALPQLLPKTALKTSLALGGWQRWPMLSEAVRLTLWTKVQT
jgi:Chemotaxis phosphatase CheX